MKKAMQVALLSMAGMAGALAAPTVQIRLHGSDRVGAMPMATAKCVAGKILASAGLGVRWDEGRRAESEAATTIDISINYGTPFGHAPRALAESFPFAREGNRVIVFFDRVEDYAQRNPFFLPRILGHVLAHEIGHVLLGTNSHSWTGLMKAHWDNADYRVICSKQLSFATEDAEAMRTWLDDQRVSSSLYNLNVRATSNLVITSTGVASGASARSSGITAP